MSTTLVEERPLDQLDMAVLRAVWLIKRDDDMLRRRIAAWVPAEYRSERRTPKRWSK